MGRLLDPTYSTIVWFFSLFMPVAGFIAIAVLLRSAPEIGHKILDKRVRVRCSLLVGVFLPSLHMLIFSLVTFVRGVSLPIREVLVRGLVPIIVSVPGLYIGFTLADRVFGPKLFPNWPDKSS